MSQEIIYTSAPSGLKPGSRGFCTVVATRGMAKNLADHLEDLSGYRHLFTGGATGGVNPVAYSHLKTTVGGRSYHILSRIGDAGLDYTQRTNKLAHHVALDPQELPPGGPAALLAASGFMTSSWSGQPQVRDAGPAVPRVESLPAVCHAWEKLTSDAGWGGVLAAELAGDSRRPIVMIYRPGTDVLALIVESLALLPASKRRQATFSTYVTKLPPTIDCRWRCYVEGTPEAESAVRQAGALIVDLRKSLGSPQESPYVDAARTGKPPRVAAPSVPAGAVAAAADDALLAALMEDDDVRPTEKVPTGATPRPAQEAFDLAPPPLRSPVSGPRSGRTRSDTKKTRQHLVVISAATVVLLSTLGIAAYIAMVARGPDRQSNEVASADPTANRISEPPESTLEHSSDVDQKESRGSVGSDSVKPSRELHPAPSSTATPSPPSPAASSTSPEVVPSPKPSISPTPTATSPPALTAKPPADINELRTIVIFTTEMNEPPVVVDKLPAANRYQISLALPANTIDGSRILTVETSKDSCGLRLLEASKQQKETGALQAAFAVVNGELTFDPAVSLSSHNFNLLKHSLLFVVCSHAEGHSTHLKYFLQKVPEVQPLTIDAIASKGTFSVKDCPRLPLATTTAQLALTKWVSLNQPSTKCLVSFDENAARVSILDHGKPVLPFVVRFRYTTQDSLVIECEIPKNELDPVLRDEVFKNINAPMNMDSLLTRHNTIYAERKKIVEEMDRTVRFYVNIASVPPAEKEKYDKNLSRRKTLELQLEKLQPMADAAKAIRSNKNDYLIGFGIGLKVNGEIVPMLESFSSK